MDTTQPPYNLNRPAHLIAADALRRINGLLWESGERFQLEGRYHDIIEQLVRQYQDALLERDQTENDAL